MSQNQMTFASLCEAALDRHIDGFTKADLIIIMADYHPDAVVQLQDKTIRGTEQIKELFTGFFKAKPAGSPVVMQRKETIISGDIGISYMWYAMKSDIIDFPLATDTFVHNSTGQIIHQTFAGYKAEVSGANAAEVPAVTAKSSRIGWIGVGQMGKGHLLNLFEKGFKDIVVWNRTAAATEEFSKLGMAVAASPMDVVQRCDVTFVMLSTPAAARDVYTREDGLLAGLSSPGKSVVECASFDAECMQQLQHWVQGKQGRFVASPVAGHSGMARNATCQLICAGDKSLFDDVNDVLDAMAKAKLWLGGDVGAASNLKLVVNGLLASITAAMTEAVAITDKAGIEREALRGVVTGHAMSSPLLQLCMNMMFSGKHDPLFMLQHMNKDVGLCAQLARSLGQESKIMNATKLVYDAAVEEGLGEQNWTAIHSSVDHSPLEKHE